MKEQIKLLFVEYPSFLNPEYSINSWTHIFLNICVLDCGSYYWDILLRIIQGIFEALKWKNWLIRAQYQFHVT